MLMLPAIVANLQPGTAATAGIPMWASGVMVVLGAGLIAMVALHLKNSRSGQMGAGPGAGRGAGRGSARPASTAEKTPAGGPTPQLARELDELGKRLAHELDTRADRLEKLIADADDRLARLERLTAASVHLAHDTAPPAPMTEMKHFGPRDAASPSGSSAIPTHRSAAAVIAEIDPLAGEVYKLADSGLMPVQIAQKLSQHTGKIELLLALRRG